MLPSEPLRRIPIPVNGGMDESSAVDEVSPEDCLEMVNWRISPDGKRIQKRYGIGNAVVGTSAPERDVYGWHTYYDADDKYCQLLVDETTLGRAVDGVWGAVHTWSGNIVHPIKPFEVQGKQFVISEVDSRMIHTDGNDYQIGINAPTTIPTLVGSYDATVFSENMTVITDWNDNDAGNGVSVQATFDGEETMRLYHTAAASGSMARRDRTSANPIGSVYSFVTRFYLDNIGSQGSPDISDGDRLSVEIHNGVIFCVISIGGDGIRVSDGTYWRSAGGTLEEDKWYILRGFVDSTTSTMSTVTLYLDDEYLATVDCSWVNVAYPGLVTLRLYGETVITDVYIDYLNIYDSSGGQLLGQYRYAVTYARSGNFGNESNPIKALVGSASFTGTGTAGDLTPGGTYTGISNRDIRVEVDALSGSSVSTFKISYDGGSTWATQTYSANDTMTLNYGIELTWADSDDHIVGDYWDFTCGAMAVNAINQKVTLTSIPTSSDPQVDQRKIYRTTSGGTKYFWLATIGDNTTTSFVDNIEDSGLGFEMRQDADPMPNGKFAVWWDDRLWVSGDNIIYYSQVDNPEAFDLDVRYIKLRKGERGNDITQMIDFRDGLYVFKKNCIYAIIKRPGGGYSRYLVEEDYGCIAPWSMIKVNKNLMFLSFRGIERYDGGAGSPINFSIAAKRTIEAIDKTKLDYIDSAHNRDYNEVWFSIPDDADGETSKILVYNYLLHKYYIFELSNSEVISFLDEAEDPGGSPRVYLGVRTGNVYQAEHTYNSTTKNYQDEGTSFTATYRKYWYNQVATGTLRRFDIKYEIPSGKTLTTNFYSEFDYHEKRSFKHEGPTISSTDIELRRIISDYCECGLEGNWFSFELINDENLGGDLKVNDVVLYATQKVIKGKKHGN